MRRLKVAFLLPTLSGGGAERASALMASALDPEVFDALVILERPGAPAYQVSATVTVERLGVDRSRQTIYPLARMLQRERPDVLYSALPHLNILAAIASRFVRPRPRLIVSVHSNQASELASVRNGRVMRLVMPWVYRSADSIVAVSRGIEGELRAVVGDRPKLRMIHDPLDVRAIQALAAEDPHHPWFDPSLELISAVGRLSREKGFLTLLEAFRVVHRTRGNARLMILGEGPQRPELLGAVERLGLGSAVQLIGFQKNPFAYLARSTCYVLSSDWEGFGMAIVEAMASGTAVLATDCQFGPAEILNNGEFGLMAKPGSIDGLANGMLRLIDDRALRHELIEKGARRAMDFDVTAVVPRYAALFEEMSGRRSFRATGSAR